MSKPFISVIVVAFNEEKNIRDCLESLTKQSYINYEVIIIDGNSLDNTVKICNEFCEKFSNFFYYINHKRFIAASRNIGLEKSKGELIAFTDADCIAPHNWLEVLVDGYLKCANKFENIAGVGGSNIAPEDGSSISKAISIVQASRLGFTGSIQGQIFRINKEVKSLSCSNAIFNKKAIIEVGGFNEYFKNIGEDYELAFRLRKSHYHLYAIAGSFVWHKLRNTYYAFSRNMFNYGKGRMDLILNLHEYRLIYLFPIFFIFIILISLMLSPFFILSLIIPIFYCLVIVMYSILLTVKQKSLLSSIIMTFFLLHISYSAGELYGLLRKN